MNLTILSCELTNLLRQRLLLLIVSISVIFSMLAIYNGQQLVAQQTAVVIEAQEEQQRAIITAKNGLAAREALTQPVNWWDDHYDLRGQAFYLMLNYATKPPLDSAAIATGQSDVLPYFFKMLVTNKQDIINQYDAVHPLGLFVGKFDFAFFVIYILPLFIIGISFNALAQERQAGQLRLLMLQGLTPLRLLINQLILRCLLVVVPTLLVSCISLVYYQPQINGEILLILCGLVIAYSMVWLSLTALVISFGKSPAYNASVLIISWLLFIIVIPALINSVIVNFNPPPSRLQYIDDLRKHTDQLEKNSSQVLAKFFEDHPELAGAETSTPVNSYSTTKIAKITALEQAMAASDLAFNFSINQQQSWIEQLKFVSPATLLQSALFQLSGNDLKRHQQFMLQVNRHHQQLRQFYQQRIVAAEQLGLFTPCQGCNAKINLANLNDVPRFVYHEGPLAMPWSSLLSLLLLSIMLMLSAVKRLISLNNSQKIDDW